MKIDYYVSKISKHIIAFVSYLECNALILLLLRNVKNLFKLSFSGMAKKSREFINRTNQRRSSGQIGDSNSSSADGDPLEISRRQLEQNEIVGGQGFYGAVTNFLVIGGFAAFAFVVQYVIQSLTIAD